MKFNLKELFRKSENEEIADGGVSGGKSSPVDRAMDNLIKMKEATKILKASAPTVRKYARLGHYREYRFGEKLVFYDKEEILNFILNRRRTAEE